MSSQFFISISPQSDSVVDTIESGLGQMRQPEVHVMVS
jgi:hypothetical protein